MNDIFAEHRALVESGRFEDAMRLSGEALARAEAELNAAVKLKSEERVRRARMFLDAGTIHLADLQFAGMAREEVSTAIMIVATLIIARVNPEDIPQQYVRWLQMIVLRLGDALQESGDDGLTGDYARLLTLAVVTAEDYAARFGLDAQTMQINDAIKDFIKMSEMPQQDYNGSPIVPQTALDILVNTLNTMATSGWISPS